MPNDLSARQWRLDTPLAYGNPGSVLFQSAIKIAHFEFSTYAAQGNRAIIKSRTGRIVWDVTGNGDLSEVRSAKIGWVDGLCLDTLDAGLVVVYTE